MEINYKYIIGTIVVWLLLWGSAGATVTGETDSLYTLRRPDPAFLEKYRNDADFRYDVQFQKENWLGELGRRVGHYLSRLFDNLPSGVFDIIWKIAVAAVILFALYWIIKSGVVSPFGKKARKWKEQAGVRIEDCPDRISYPALLQDALERRDFIAAVRIRYLYLLRLLDEKGWIEWETGKTNTDYIRELKAADKRAGFRELSRMFDCVCYGHFGLDEELYRKIEARFTGFQKEVES